MPEREATENVCKRWRLQKTCWNLQLLLTVKYYELLISNMTFTYLSHFLWLFMPCSLSWQERPFINMFNKFIKDIQCYDPYYCVSWSFIQTVFDEYADINCITNEKLSIFSWELCFCWLSVIEVRSWEIAIKFALCMVINVALRPGDNRIHFNRPFKINVRLIN